MKENHNILIWYIDITLSQCISIIESYHMQKRQKIELLPLDILLERTLRNLKKVRIDEAVAIAEQEGIDQHIQVELTTKRPQRQKTIEDF